MTSIRTAWRARTLARTTITRTLVSCARTTHAVRRTASHLAYRHVTCTWCARTPQPRTTYGMAEARTHLQRDAVEDQIAELDRFPDEERAAVAQQHRNGEPERLHREEENQAWRADRRHHAVDEARRLAVQPSDGAGRRETLADLVHDLRIYRT